MAVEGAGVGRVVLVLVRVAASQASLPSYSLVRRDAGEGKRVRLLDPYTVRSDKRGGRRPTDAWESELGKARTSHGHGLFKLMLMMIV